MKTSCPSDPPAVSQSGFNRFCLVEELLITSTVSATYTYGQFFSALVEQLALTPNSAASFMVKLRKIAVYATKAGDPRDVPRIAVSFRTQTGAVGLQPLVVEDRGTLTHPAKVAALMPGFATEVGPSTVGNLLVVSGNGAAAPRQLLVTVMIWCNWRVSALSLPDKISPMLRVKDAEDDSDSDLDPFDSS